MKQKIAILGGGGRTGTFLVKLLLKKGYSLKLLLREPEKFKIQSPLIEIVKGDAIDPLAIQTLLSDCKFVISTIGQRLGEPMVASKAALNILNAMSDFDISRYINVAGINLDTPSDSKGKQTQLATDWMKINFSEIQSDRQKAYTLIADSSLRWTLVRVPMIIFEESRGEILVDEFDCLGNKITAADIAIFLFQQLNDKTFIGKSPFIANS